MNKIIKPKLCYILPEYREDDATHFSHIHDFLKEISEFFDIYLVILKGSNPPESLGFSKAYVLKSGLGVLGMIEMKMVLLKARFSGYRDFYIHYSFLAAFVSSFIVRIFGGRTFYWNCGEPWKYKRAFLRELFEGLTYKLVTFVVTGARSLAEQYAEIYGLSTGKIKIMPNWIDIRRFTPGMSREKSRKKLNLPPDKKIILFIHRLSPRKGSRMIVPVAGAVIGRNKDAYFVIVGNGPDDDYLRGAVVESALDDSILIVGSIPNRLIPEYLIASDIFFMPSEEEGFPRVLLESMALRVPYTASDVGAVREITPEAGSPYIVKSGDVAGFVGALLSLINQPSGDREVLIEEMAERVKDYDISTVTAKFRNLF